jgi:ferric-dicitrate binding protein FerR (iron transport regulator)
MDKHYIIKLLHKYLSGDLTIEERQFLESYYKLFQDEPDILDTLSAGEKEDLKNNIKAAVWDEISKDQKAFHKVRFLNKKFINVAAAAVIFIICIASLFFLFNTPSKKQTVENKNLAMLNPIENRVIFLPDGSTVILSPGSKLNYPSSFDGMQKREVFLDGQAFFDIKHNATRPFIVHTGKIETIVLGTAFNIKALPGEKEITVTVKRGKVKVIDENKELGIITPNQQITYNKEKVSSDIKVVDSDSYLNWKEQDLLFDNLTIAEAAKLLEEKYKVEIVISDSSISSQRFTATFTKNDTFEQALKSICVFNGVNYKYNKEKSAVIITNKN